MDIRTLFIVIGLVYLLVPLAVFYSLREVRDRSSNLWCLSWIAFGAGALAIGLRGNIPDFVSFYLAHGLMLAGYIWRSESILLEIGPIAPERRAIRDIRLWAVAVYMAIFVWMINTGVSDNTRISVVNGFFTVFFLDTLYLVLRLRKERGYAGAKLLAIMCCLFAMGHGMRSIGAASDWGGYGAFGAGTDQIVIMLSALLGFIMGNFGFIQLRTEKLMLRTEIIRGELEDSKQMSNELAGVLKEKNNLLKQLAISSNAARSGITASTVTHELSQPLNAMTLNLDYVRRKISEGERIDKLSEAIEDIWEDSKRANDILGRIRVLFMQGSEDFQPVNFSQIASEVLAINHDRMTRAGIKTAFDIEPGIEVIGDAVQLRMLLMNLVTNSVEALEASADPKTIACSLRLSDGVAFFDIVDNGPGISEDAAKDIFDLYVSSKAHGSGIGLWLCKLIAEHHKGSIQYRRAETGGAHFSLQLSFAMA